MKEFLVTDDGDISDGHHTFKELYQYRLLYNAALFNEWAKLGRYDVHKSRLHHDGTVPFGDPKWFVVMAQLPTGQISNHYRSKDWYLFQIPESRVSSVYDGHTPAEVADRLESFLISSSSICIRCGSALLQTVHIRGDLPPCFGSWENL